MIAVLPNRGRIDPWAQRKLIGCLIALIPILLSVSPAAAKSVVLIVSATGFCVGERYKGAYKEVEAALLQAIRVANSKVSSSSEKIETLDLQDMQCDPRQAVFALQSSIARNKPDFVFMWSTTGSELRVVDNVRKDFPSTPIIAFRSSNINRSTKAASEALNAWIDIQREHGPYSDARRELLEDKFFLRMQAK